MSKGTRKVLRDGKWEDGKASPWLPPEQLRQMPQSWTTKEEADADRIHELDPPHIVKALAHEQATKEEAGTPPENLLEKYDLWGGPLDQTHIDLIRFKAIRNLIRTAQVYAERGAVFPLKKLRHLWFPKNRLDPRELRDGRPPLRFDLPQHLKDKDLIVDVYNWPARVVDMLTAKGIEVPDIARLEAQMEASRSMVLQ